MWNDSPHLWIRFESQDLFKTDSVREALFCWGFSFVVFNFEIYRRHVLLRPFSHEVWNRCLDNIWPRLLLNDLLQQTTEERKPCTEETLPFDRRTALCKSFVTQVN